jgi:hypothetical protein
MYYIAIIKLLIVIKYTRSYTKTNLDAFQLTQTDVRLHYHFSSLTRYLQHTMNRLIMFLVENPVYHAKY